MEIRYTCTENSMKNKTKAFLYACNFYIYGLIHGQVVDFWDCYKRRLTFLDAFTP